jgi:uncharacterized membrane protein YukC
MCSQCDQINAKIERLQALASKVLDQQTLDGIAELIRELGDQKAALHPNSRVGWQEQPWNRTWSRSLDYITA